jgi:serine/threonine protein kinase
MEEITQMVCWDCGALNPIGSEYCRLCGAPLSGGEQRADKEESEMEETMQMVCWDCGALNPVGSEYCRLCGAPLSGGEQRADKEGSETESEAQGISCWACGARNPVGSRLCQTCGSSLLLEEWQYPLPVGTKLKGGAYTVGKVLGQGGFGFTYKGSDTRLHRVVAIKEFFLMGCIRQGTLVIADPFITPADFEAMKQHFLQEARTSELFKLNHPGIQRVYDAFEENNTAYIVMEFLEGKPLSRLLEERGGVMEEAEAVGYILQAAEALEAVHQAGYLHRDIKPDNIFVCKDGRVVLVSFGIAEKYVAGEEVEMEPILTPGYAPLEQYTRRARFGPPLDIYALGATLYHLLTGQVPPPAPDRLIGMDLLPPHQLNPKVSRSVSEAVMKAMAIRVEERPQTMRAFIEALRGEMG